MRLREPFRISSGRSHQRRILLVELEDADGAVGWGECVADVTPHYSAETVDTAWLAIPAWIAPVMLGREWDSPEDLRPALELAFRGHPMAKAAVEMAAWHLEAERQGRSLSALLGGSRPQVATGISLGIQDSPEQLARRTTESHEAGYRRIKVKIGPGRDLAFVAAAREALGSQPALSVDANSAYRLDDAPTLAQLDRFELVMIEQPLAADDLLRHASLQPRLATPICLDESITGPDRAEDMIQLGSGRIINIKPGRVGGHTSARLIHDLARAVGIPVWCGGMLETGIGRAHNVALASLPGFSLPGDLSPSARYWEQDIVDPPWTMEQGMVAVPRHRPGLGVEVDRERIEELTVRRLELPSSP